MTKNADLSWGRVLQGHGQTRPPSLVRGVTLTESHTDSGTNR